VDSSQTVFGPFVLSKAGCSKSPRRPAQALLLSKLVKNQVKHFVILGLNLLLVGATLVAGPSALAADKATMGELQKLLHAEEDMRSKLDGKLVDTLKDMQNVKSTSFSGDVLDATLSRHEVKVGDVKDLLVENHLRIDFLNSLLEALEKTDDVRKDAAAILLDLSHRQILGNMESGVDTKVWLFELYLSIAIRDIMEPSENFTDFVKQYMLYSSVHDPRTPAEFLKSRDYMGGNPASSKKSADATATGD
jgi:hypothetical protein